MVAVQRVLLIRHGQTDWNVQGRWQGDLPTDLNGEGIAQAGALARYMNGRTLGAIYSSDLPRAWQTATILGQGVNVTPKAEVRLREFNLGIFQGSTTDEMPVKFPNEWREFRANYWDYQIIEGESRRSFQDRVYAAWLDIIERESANEVAFVSHGGAIKMLLMRLFPEDNKVSQVHIENTSVTVLERFGERWGITDLAAIHHLRQPSLDGTVEGDGIVL